MRRPDPGTGSLRTFVFAAACLAVMAVAVAFVVDHDLVANATQAMTGVGEASLLATGILSMFRF